jgi:3-oxoisoapionate kinase
MAELLLSYYGDDLTGSTDVMEALASRGVATVLFTRQPTSAQRAKFSNVRAIGLAGSSRSETTAWMDEHLTPALAWLKTLGAAFCHYKVCSTFDSSPTVGSIGRAIDIGQRLFAQDSIPLVVGAPQLKRYTAFGNLFAAYQGRNYRIDRHPVMARHPVTPMTEADLRLHLGKQTEKTIGLADVTMLEADDVEERVDAIIAQGAQIVLLDVVDIATQRSVGRELVRLRRDRGAFVVGSSGVEYALLTEWERAGLIAAAAPRFAEPGPVDRLAVVSGSCSATTERQIRYAQAHGFDAFAIDPKGLATGEGALISRAIQTGLESLAQGRSVVLYTALGPETDVGAQFETEGARHAIGRALGDIHGALIERAGLRRAVIAGGDTSSHALRQLGVYALTTRLPLPTTPGSPLCLAHSDEQAFDGLEIALKGGQVGSDDYFDKIRLGSI